MGGVGGNEKEQLGVNIEERNDPIELKDNRGEDKKLTDRAVSKVDRDWGKVENTGIEGEISCPVGTAIASAGVIKAEKQFFF